MVKNTVNTRELVLDMLMEIYSEKEYSHKVIKSVLDKYDYLSQAEKAFMKRMTEGCVERRIELDYCINQFSKVPVNKMKPLIRALLRMSVYQILFMDSVPDSAVCNEAVKLAQKRKFGSLKGFVNGVLRNIARGKEEIVYPDRKKEYSKAISVQYSMPEWLVKLWQKTFGKEVAEQIVSGLLEERPITIRVDERLSAKQKEELLSGLEKKGVEITPQGYLPYAYELKNIDRIGELPGFEQGQFTVQDVSSMLVAEIAGVKKGMHVIDVCAAPGGKTMHVAHKLEGSGLVESRDLTEYKVDYIKENIERMKLQNVKAAVVDATVFLPESKEVADLLLADVPCSGLGVMGKKRDIKYRAKPESLETIVALQKEIITTIWKYVKIDGVMIYSTCTIQKEENEEMVAWITENFPFELESMDEYLPENLQSETTKNGYLQLLPGVHKTDGFFMARLRRIKSK